MSFGVPTYFFESLPSTNDYASELISKKEVEEGTVIETAYQTAGHGQKDRTWYSPEGQNITLSLILRPLWLQVEVQFLLNVMTSLAIVETLEEIGISNIRVKWPNDVYVSGKKISGILIKNHLQGSKIQSSIVGIGLNVLQTTWNDNIPNATSIFLEAGETIEIDQVKPTLLSKLEFHYNLIRTNSKEAIKTYNKLLYMKDEEKRFTYEGQQLHGIVRSIDQFGRLNIEMKERMMFFGIGEITFH